MSKKYYYLDAAEEVSGPLELAELDAMHKAGKIMSNTQVCEEGTENWTQFFQLARPAQPKAKIVEEHLQKQPTSRERKQPTTSDSVTNNVMTKDITPIIGRILLGIGFIVIAYFFFVFKTDIEGEGYHVNNLGLMNDKQNGIIVGGILSIVGAILGIGKVK